MMPLAAREMGEHQLRPDTGNWKVVEGRAGFTRKSAQVVPNHAAARARAVSAPTPRRDKIRRGTRFSTVSWKSPFALLGPF